MLISFSMNRIASTLTEKLSVYWILFISEQQHVLLIYISHKLNEVKAISDTIFMLSVTVSTLRTAQIISRRNEQYDDIITMMV
ncbi:hypothetical protein DJICPGNB_17780 [Escherichia coli]|nr:hypothetical protein DJICPGNB_17780 [Escherichia coli]